MLMHRTREIMFAALIVVAMAVGAAPTHAQDTAPPKQAAPPPPALYTQAQAARGEEVFERVCASCHKTPQFTGRTFHTAWTGQTVGKLYTFISTMMPGNNPGSLPDQQYADVATYILRLNGYPAGKDELPADAERLAAYLLELK